VYQGFMSEVTMNEQEIEQVQATEEQDTCIPELSESDLETVAAGKGYGYGYGGRVVVVGVRGGRRY